LTEEDAMTVDEKESGSVTQTEPEVEVYISLLVVVFLIDNKKFDIAVDAINHLIQRMDQWNRRTLDPLSAKVYFYFSRAHELSGKLADIRLKLLQLLKTATLRHNFDGQIGLINLLLRNYLHYKLYDQAEKLAERTPFKFDKASTYEAARYHFYLGKINAIKLCYTEAYNNLQQALRKGPRTSGKGFRSIVMKYSLVVQMLLGEIPERSLFRTKGIRHSLKPYLELTQAVRSGSIDRFHQVISDFNTVFKKDNTYLLVQRLHHNVIKTGLKKINTSYSRISFKDICTKLHLENEQDVEYIVAKAIRDNIIDATIDHQKGYLQSNENVDIYSTNEPQKAFHSRISFCLEIHNEAMKAMRYPPDSWKKRSEENETKDDEEEIVELLKEAKASDL
jgi:26S proteasome regulatory subunit N3